MVSWGLYSNWQEGFNSSTIFSCSKASSFASDIDCFSFITGIGKLSLGGGVGSRSNSPDESWDNLINFVLTGVIGLYFFVLLGVSSLCFEGNFCITYSIRETFSFVSINV